MSAQAAFRHELTSSDRASPRYRLRAASLLVLLVYASLLLAQTRELRFEHITLEGGLTEYRAFDIAQDSIGFLWFATSEGLYRYDGLTTTAFKPRLNDPSGISSITIWSLLTDRSGKVWIGTFDAGLDCFDPATGRFSHFRHDPADSTGINRGPITALAEDRTGALWIGTEHDGLARLDPSTRGFQSFRHSQKDPKSLSSNDVKALCVDQRGTLWVGTTHGLNALPPGDSAFRVLRHNPVDRASLSGNHITSLLCDRSGAIWAGTRSNGLSRIDGSTWRVTRYSRNSQDLHTALCDSVISLSQVQADYFWVGTANGLYRLKPVSGELQHFKHDPFNNTSLSGDYLRAVRADRTGTLWIAADRSPESGTQVRCINKLDPKSDQFAYLRVERRGGGNAPVTAILHDRNTNITWIGAEGLRALNQSNGRVIEYVHDPANPRSLSDNHINSLYVDNSGDLWIGTWSEGLNRFLPSTSSFSRYRWKTSQGDVGGSALCICEDQAGDALSLAGERKLWIGTFDEGVILFSTSRGILRRYPHVAGDGGSLGSNRVLAMLVDRRGELWVGTDGGGLNRLDRTADHFVHYTYDSRNASSLRSPRIYSLLEDEASYSTGGAALWVGTATGLDHFDIAREKAEHIILRDSAEAIGIRGIVHHDNDLWISTVENGLFRRSLRTGTTRAYSSRNGLPSNAFLRSSWITPDGQILFGLDEGFVSFHPDSIRDNPYEPRIVLTGFNIFDVPYQTHLPLWSTFGISLAYDQDFFSFRFAALDYTDPHSNTFAYKLEGFDKEWNNPGTRNFAGYTKVDPGEYTFRVKGANSDGRWNESGTSIGLRIDPPYWRTWWFRAMIGAIVLALLAGAYRYRVGKLLEMERMRLRIASDLHDDVGSSLSGIALVTESLKSRQGLGERDKEHLADVSRTARRTADTLRDIVWLVNPEHDTVDDLFLRLKDAAAMVLTGIEYAITTSGESLSSTMPLEFRHNLILIYKEILNNIAKHARAHHVTIAIRQENGTVLLRIEDDGVGFDPASEQRGNGLRNLHRRAEQVGGMLTLESEPGKGTVVTLTAPVP